MVTDGPPEVSRRQTLSNGTRVQRAEHTASAPEEESPGRPSLHSLPCPPGEKCPFDRMLRGAIREQLREGAGQDGSADALTGAPTEVGALVDEALWAVSRLMPCDRCRGAEAAVRGLKRLGEVERSLLLAAAAPDAEPSVLKPPTQSRSAAETQNRALRTLRKGGLLSVCNAPVERDAYGFSLPRSRAVRRTFLGQAVVERLEPVLTSGGPIRWTRHRPALLAVVRHPTSELLAEFENALARHRKDYVDICELETRLARVRRANAGAESCDRHLALVDLVLLAIEIAQSGASTNR